MARAIATAGDAYKSLLRKTVEVYILYGTLYTPIGHYP